MGTDSQFCATIAKFSSLLAFCVRETPRQAQPDLAEPGETGSNMLDTAFYTTPSNERAHSN